ncbi:S8 family serine peptidase [Plantactinospora mayteni]|uniref:Serine protease n=1 Tax=Plantactinospora mayteni TaxID=566021 RepID=A0ABQ4F4M9_9ACTN|nr:S8 family serine peptidase [Plantactinospora mayteni]GIH01876.1 serine protease [Plantactinospora mayteni]
MSRLRQRQPLPGRAAGGLLTAALVAGVGLVAVPSAWAATPRTAVRTAGAAATTEAPQRSAESPRTVTLVTGDRVTVSGADLGNVSVSRGSGRDGVTFLVSRADGHLRVVPSDALTPLRAGLLDSRLFDVTTLLDFGYDDRRSDLPLIVTYAEGAKGDTARSGTAAAGGRVLRALPGRATFAVRAGRQDGTTVWQRLTTGKRGTSRLADGVVRVRLDGKLRPALDVSVPQIGAPAAWQAGYTGKGVTVALLDTGVDADHPDLSGRVSAAENFVADTEDGRDLDGHGTHVAATIAGSGAASNGRYKGVAPEAQLISGKVCALGGCPESAILAGMWWAAAERHAKVVNMSLGGRDTPEVDPIEQAVQDLTAQYGTLFVVAAGNDGGDGTVRSPATADAALAVGAVNADDTLAEFSNRGPRVGDFAVKPDITAPGVDITAARSAASGLGNPGDMYTTMSGTSMATPHVTGSAALLVQQHPTWSGSTLKAALMASAAHQTSTSVYGQGAGRVDVGRAIGQQVTANPPSAAFGRRSWPHDDDQPVRQTITYHNAGASPVVLDLAVQATGPDGGPAPAGVFTLGTPRLTVPAGGDAETTLTADTSEGAAGDTFVGYVTATAADRVVRTPIAVALEAESYDLTLNHIDRAGAPSTTQDTIVVRTDTFDFHPVASTDGTATIRLPKGRYAVASTVLGADGTSTFLVQPPFAFSGDRTIALDARLGKPITVTIPQPSATSVLAEMQTTISADGGRAFSAGMMGDTFRGIYSAQLGGDESVDGVVTRIGSQWAAVGADGSTLDSPYAYRLAWFHKGFVPTGFSRNVRPGDLGTVRATYASATPELLGHLAAFPRLDGLENMGSVAQEMAFHLPAVRTEYYSTEGGVHWGNQFLEWDRNFEHPAVTVLSGAGRYQAGREYAERWNRGVLAPSLPDTVEAYRRADTMQIEIPLYSDDPNRRGSSYIATGTTTLLRNGVQVDQTPELEGMFTVPPDDASYQVRIDATRPAPAVLATRTNVEWSFRSKHVPGDTPTKLPLSVVRYTPALDGFNAAPTGETVQVPVTVLATPGSSAGRVRTLTIDVSYDDGKTWQRAPLVRSGDSGVITLHHPETAGYVSLRAAATDTAGNAVRQTTVRAYRLTATR